MPILAIMLWIVIIIMDATVKHILIGVVVLVLLVWLLTLVFDLGSPGNVRLGR